MYDVTGVNVFPRKFMEFPRKEKVNSVPYPLLVQIFFFISIIYCSTFSFLAFLFFFFSCLVASPLQDF